MSHFCHRAGRRPALTVHDGRPCSRIQEICRLVNCGLWALGAALLVWVLLHRGELVDAQAQAELQRARQAEFEDRAYCVKWGLPAGTPRFAERLRDLAALRESVTRDSLAAADGLL